MQNSLQIISSVMLVLFIAARFGTMVTDDMRKETLLNAVSALFFVAFVVTNLIAWFFD